MGIFFDALKGMLTGKDEAARWADPNCPSCEGTGYPIAYSRTGSYERCYCSNNRVIAEATEWRRQEQQRAVHVRSQVFMPRVIIEGLEDVPVRELSLEQKEQLRIEARVRSCVTPEAKQAIDAGRLTMCCASSPCKCGVNHWVQLSPALGSVPPPAPGSPWFNAWQHHRAFVLQLQSRQ